MRRKNTLFIYGNGADLYSGLDTKFSDYINPKKQSIQNAFDNFKKFKSIIKSFEEGYNLVIPEYSRGKIQNFPLMVLINGDSAIRNLKKDISHTFSMDPGNNTSDNNEILDNFITELYSLNENLSKSLQNLNFWETLSVVCTTDGDSWFDIETLIKKYILAEKILSKPRQSIFKYIDSLLEELINENYEARNDWNSPLNYNLKGCSWFCFTLCVLLKNHIELIDGAVSSCLLKELYKFEISFSYYVKDNMDHHPSYFSEIGELTNTLMSVSKNKSANLLTFNYTTPNLRPFHVKKIKNIHGSINNNYHINKSPIVIGIDSNIDDIYHEDEKDYENIFSFTKTKRILSLVNNHINVLDSNIDEIVFFGHALGKSDYSYFQAIFDYYDIYNSNIVLKFVFSPQYSISDDKKTMLNKDMNKLESQSVKVSKLINRYGKTLDNINHGNNLLHKLLTQERISIININDFKSKY